MPNINLVSISPGQLCNTGQVGSYDISCFEKKYLAQGDSWFSIGHVPPWATTNLLQQMALSRSAVAVNCARPGVELSHMTDTSTAQVFLNLLNGNIAWHWDAILISGGGNDLIDAVLTAPQVDAAARILLNAGEWFDPPVGVSRYISQTGWDIFANHMEDVLQRLLVQRDRGVNRGVPLVLHTYDYTTVRDASAGPGLGPWLYKAMSDLYRIPVADWDGLSDELINRMATMWLSLGSRFAAQNVVIVDSRGTLTRATPDDKSVSGDWENEIHPTPHGFTLLAQQWRLKLDGLAA